MFPTNDLASLDREELVALVLRLQRQVSQLTLAMEGLRKEIAELKRAGKRQAAPFSKGTHQPNPKPPGRRPGRGTFNYRRSPAPQEVTEPPVDVPVALAACPKCGGRLQPAGTDLAYLTDIPAWPQPIVTQYRVQVCRCVACGRRVRGRHPALAPDQRGATAHRLGSRLMAAAHLLHYGVGIPVRRVPQVLRVLTGVKVTQSAITQDALRRAQGTVGQAYQELRRSVRHSPVTHTDDTGWRVGGEAAFLMAFETDRVSVYQVRPRHRNQEVREVVPSDYAGVLVSDRGRTYDSQSLAQVRQQKCLAHVLRSISQVVETKKGRGRSFGLRLSGLLREAMELERANRLGGAVDFAAQAQRLTREVTYHLRDRPLPDADNWRLQNQLGWHHDRGNLLRFLKEPGVEPTNNRAERALRPAVIARKVSHCSKNIRGAEAFSAFTSVLRTLAGRSDQYSVEDLCRVFQGTPLPAHPL